MFNSKAGDQPSLQQPFAHKKVFNVTLPELLKSHVKLSWSVDGDSKYIPVILKKFAFNIERKDIIETVGLFRLAASSKETREYRDRIEKTGDVDFSKLDPSNNAVIWTLMKTFLREIPDSIVPISLFNNLTDSMGILYLI